jgi:pimeloyl-ACP methyl ester carboxylesterase
VLDRGTGTPVVLLHGNGSMIQDFVTSGLVDRLANRHRVVVLDRPGFGYSARPRNQVWSPAAQAKLFHAVLNRLGVEKPVIVGHSWGTLPAIELGLQHPTEVRGLVLLSGHYYPTLRLDVAMLSPPALPIIGDLMRYTISPVVGRVFARKIIRKLFAPARVPPEFAEFPIGMALRPSQIRSSADETALLMPVNGATHEHYRTLKMPVAILAGAEDRIVASERQSRRLHAELPHSELRLVPNAGHMIHHTASAEVLRAIDEIVGAGATPK